MTKEFGLYLNLHISLTSGSPLDFPGRIDP